MCERERGGGLYDDHHHYRFYIALFSALEQIYCALVVCGSKCVITLSTARFEFPPKWCTYKVAAPFGCCMVCVT